MRAAQVPNASASAALPELLDVLQATGRRKPIGSATAFNEATINDLGTGSQQDQPKMERAKRKPHEFLQRHLPAPLAANLKMQQLVVLREIGGE